MITTFLRHSGEQRRCNFSFNYTKVSFKNFRIFFENFFKTSFMYIYILHMMLENMVKLLNCATVVACANVA